jgi:hypothetical protein
MKKDIPENCINCIEWLEGPYADCSKCSDIKRNGNGRILQNDDRAHKGS